MTKEEIKLHRLIENSDWEWKEKTWQRLVREHIGCDCCQHYLKKKELCKIGHQHVLESCRGVPCDDIKPTVLKKRRI